MAEQWIKDGKQVLKMTRLSCHRSRSNEVMAVAERYSYDPGSLWRWLVLSARINNWWLTSLQQSAGEDR